MRTEEIKEILEFLNDDIMELCLNNRNDNLSEKGKIKLKAYTRLRENLTNKEQRKEMDSKWEELRDSGLDIKLESWEQEQPKQSVEPYFEIIESDLDMLSKKIDFGYRYNHLNKLAKEDLLLTFNNLNKSLEALKEYTQTQSVVSDENISHKILCTNVHSFDNNGKGQALYTSADLYEIAEWVRNKLNKSE